MSTPRETTVNRVKTDLRISHTALDADLSDQIDACLADLEICGVVNPDETDPVILAVIKIWCRTQYTDDTTKAAAYQARYDAMKGTLMVATGYGGDPDDD